MFCPYCGKELKDGEICACPQSQFQPDVQEESAANVSAWKGNEKIFSILSYIGILWLVGLLVTPEKEDSKVKFHVGQGIVLTIFDAALGIVMGIINAILGAIFELTFLGMGLGRVSDTGLVLQSLVSLAGCAVMVFFIVKGILNVVQNKQEPLPIIGRFAFYK